MMHNIGIEQDTQKTCASHVGRFKDRYFALNVRGLI
jgi:hypothetical protein